MRACVYACIDLLIDHYAGYICICRVCNIIYICRNIYIRLRVICMRVNKSVCALSLYTCECVRHIHCFRDADYHIGCSNNDIDNEVDNKLLTDEN